MSDPLRIPDWNTQRMWFPSVTMRKLVGHIQGLAFRMEQRDDIAHDRLTAYCTVSDFPPGWGAVLINDNDQTVEDDPARYSDMTSLSIPMSNHPGAIDIDGDLMVVPHERSDRTSWISLWDISNPGYPELVDEHDFDPDPPESLPGFDPDKASASGIVRTRNNGVLVTTLSQSRYLRVSSGAEIQGKAGLHTRDPIDLRVAAEQAGVSWPKMVDACSLLDTSAIDDERYLLVLFGFANHFTYMPCWNRQSVLLAEIEVPQDVTKPVTIERWRTAPIPRLRRESNGVRQTWRDVLRPSTRWGATAFWTGPRRCAHCRSNLWLRLPDCVDEAADHIELATIEHSGNEFGEAPARNRNEQTGPTQFVQFRTTLPLEPTPSDHAPTNRFVWPRPEPHEVHRQRLGAPRSALAWGLGMFAAWILFIRAVSQQGVVAGVVLACIAAAIGIFSINAFLATYDRFVGTKKRFAIPIGGVLVCLGAGLAADALEAPWLALAAMVVGLHFPPLIAHWIDPTEGGRPAPYQARAALDERDEASAPTRSLISAASVAIPVLVGTALRVGGAASLLLLLALALLVWVKFRTPRAYPTGSDTRKLAAVAAASVIGALFFGALWPTSEGIGAALAFAVTVLSVLGVHLHFVDQHYEPPAHHTAVGLKRWMVLLASAAFAIAAALFTWSSVADSGVLLLALVAAAGFGAFLVWPREGTYALILAGMVFAWAVADTDGNTLPVSAELSGNWHVVLGDSFISGEGADEFIDGTNTRPENVCRRAATAWPNLMEPGGSTDHGTMSFACSGAVLSNIVETAQYPQATGTNAGATSQLDALESWLGEVAAAGGTVSHVFISGGGNDAGFADLIAACLTPSSMCSDDESASAFLSRANDLGVTKNGVSPLEATYRAAIRKIDASNTAHPDGVTVVAATYVDPVSSYIEGRTAGEASDPCPSLQGGSLLRNEEAFFVNEFREAINRQILAAVQAVKQSPEPTTGRYWVEALSLENALNDRSVCSDDAGINWIDLRPADDNIARKLLSLDSDIAWGASQLLPTNWVNSSLHPNESGHRSMALVANLCLDALADAADAAEGSDSWGTEWVCAEPEPNFNLLAASTCTDLSEQTDAFCEKTTAEVATDGVLRDIRATAGRRLGLGIALAVVAGFLFAAFWTLPRVPSGFVLDRLRRPKFVAEQSGDETTGQPVPAKSEAIIDTRDEKRTLLSP